MSLRDLVESNWLRDNDIDECWRLILSSGCDQYPSPTGYIIEVDIQNAYFIDRLAHVLANHNEVMASHNSHWSDVLMMLWCEWMDRVSLI
jgi:hypothetical protein